MTGPDPPMDIRLHMTDGTSIPVEAVYTGVDKYGCHVWEVVTTAVHINRLRTMTVGELPARTSIVLHVDEAS